MALTKEEEQRISAACYSIGSAQIAPWLRRIVELEHRVSTLGLLSGPLLAQRERDTVNV
jgi:hypothetical protein